MEFIIKDAKPIVALVEDESSLLKVMENILKNEYELLLCENGLQALKKIKDKSPTLIISDVMMPIMDGFELKYELNKDKELKKIPFVFITALSKNDIKNQLDTLDVKLILSKPIKIKEIRELVKELVNPIQTSS